MTKWSFTYAFFPERVINIETSIDSAREVSRLMLERYMYAYHRNEYDEDVPLSGTVKNETTGELYEVCASGSTYVSYEYQIDRLSLQCTFPDPVDKSGDHPDQIQLEEVIGGGQTHGSAPTIAPEAGAVTQGFVERQNARTMFDEPVAPYTAKASAFVDFGISKRQ